MAIVLDAFASYVRDLLTQAANDEVGMLLGISGEIKKLEGNLENLKAFLADAERRRITDVSVQGWVRKLKDAMYDATDILELCQLKAEERRESMGGSSEDKPPGCCHPLLFCLRNPVFAHKMGSHIKALNQKLDNIHKMAADFKFSIIGSYPHRMADIDADLPSRKTMSEMEQSAIVGEKIERDTRELVQELTTNGDSSSIKVVSIVGIGGIGKTTLAQKIFNDETINEHFKKKMWLSVTQNFDEAELLRTAISHAGGHHGREQEQDKTLLVRALKDTLSASKFLLVLDDMWSDKAWNDVLRIPIVNAGRKQPGSRVVVTTRKEDLARRMHVPFHQHHVSKLDDEDAWSLLKKQLPQVVGNESDIDQLRDIGMGIIKKCDGLPLAVKVMGGLLSTRYPSEHEWKCVLNDPAWSVEMPKELEYPLYFSYEDLSPPQLKQCFLYYSLLPKCFSFGRDVVISMWISEGFVQDDGSSQVEEIGTKYYRELITRNLIEPDRSKSSIGYACKMHDVVRTFAQYMAREESLVLEEQITGSNNSLVSGKFRRLSIAPTKSIPKWADLQHQESLRTLIINCKINLKPGDSLDSFSSLRVLDIKLADADRLVGSLCHLKHLRYLSLFETDISGLPEDIDKMKFLQYIMLFYCRKLVRLPGCIVRLVHLRTLRLDGSNVSVVPKGFGGLTNLRSLFCFPVHMDSDGGWCSLEELAPLSQLRHLTLEGLENVSASLFAEKAMISSKEHLSYLQLNCNSRSTMDPGVQQQQQIIEEVFNKLCPSPCCLENVVVLSYFGRRLPDWMWAPAAAAFKSLRYLAVGNLTYCTQLPDGWCRLPSLEGLNIEYAPAIKRVGPEFQSTFHQLASGEATVTSSFPKLRLLELIGLSEWEEWEWSWEEQEQEDISKAAIAMPALEELQIKWCSKLSRLPSGLANSKRRALRKVFLYSLTNLISVENFPSVVELDVLYCPRLKSISGLSRLQKIRIVRCPNIEVLEGVPALDSMVLEDSAMETVPGYLLGVNPRYLWLGCSKKLFDSLSQGSSSEWDKIRHVREKVAIGYFVDRSAARG